MRTKFHIIINGTSHEVSSTDIKNWDEVKFTLERKDFTGVVRSFSSDFDFVGNAYTLLRDLYLEKGFLAEATVAVSTKNNDWTYTEQFRCPLDFSSVSIKDGTLSISSIDNTLSSLLKAKKSTKYEFPVSDFATQNIEVNRITLSSSQQFTFGTPNLTNTWVELTKGGDLIVTTDYIEPANETHNSPENEFFAKVNKIGATLRVFVTGTVRCWLSPQKKGQGYSTDIPIAYLQVRTEQSDESAFSVWADLIEDDICHKRINGVSVNMIAGGAKDIVFNSLQDLRAYGGTLHDGMFGIVLGTGGSSSPTDPNYWSGNIVYEYCNGSWLNKGAPEDYYQDRYVSASSSLSATNRLTEGCYVQLWCSGQMTLNYASMKMEWSDPVGSAIACRAITPLDLANRIVDSISPGSVVTIANDAVGLLAETYIVPGEELRRIGTAKVYSTFQQFADWMEAVFGYSYRISGSTVEFLHRSALFTAAVKVVANTHSVEYSINSDLIYAEVQAGYGKKDYGEINGRYEANFTNYYTTGYNSTDKKLQLISKYRADAYGIEYTMRKSDSESQDDEADEDVFVLHCVAKEGHNTPVFSADNSAYGPAVCIANNEAYIAALGNGKAVTLTMTSSDGNNELANVEIAAGTAIFTAGELEFTTDDMILPEDWNGLVQVDHDGYRYTGYISKAEACFARQGGIEYTLIVKEIKEL